MDRWWHFWHCQACLIIGLTKYQNIFSQGLKVNIMKQYMYSYAVTCNLQGYDLDIDMPWITSNTFHFADYVLFTSVSHVLTILYCFNV